MHKETRFSVFSVNEERVREAVIQFISPAKDRFGRVLEAENRVVGCFFGHLSDLWFSNDLCGFDDVFYIGPEHRGGMSAARMVNDFERWCHSSGASAVLVGVSSGVMVDRTGAFLMRLGYERLGGIYRRHF